MQLASHIGDTRTLSIPLRWGNRAFVPGGYDLLWTLKADPLTETDAQAKVQKRSGYGISVTGTKAIVSLIPIDTAGGTVGGVTVQSLIPRTYYWDIQAKSLTNAEDVRTVASGTLVLLRDVTRGHAPSIPIYVYLPPEGGLPSFVYLTAEGDAYTDPDGNYYVGAQP